MLDLMVALQESVLKVKAARDAGEAEVHELPKPKKAAAKKRPAKRTAAKQATTKKTSGRPPVMFSAVLQEDRWPPGSA
ncbi:MULTISPECIES: hypothetical protein [unclassified Streptomyces]|uniref:hypothetical protein n=1 Tax=unclassified Streptomyces TaxID=2593676 RepID=UPI004041C690